MAALFGPVVSLAGCPNGASGGDGGGGTDAGPPDLAMVVHRSGPARDEAAVGYDAMSKKVVLFGGNDGMIVSTVMVPNYHNDTWVWDRATSDWTLSAATGPSARGRAAFAVDTMNHRLLMAFGRWRDLRSGTNYGRSYTLPADTWAYDFAADAWTELTPTSAPPGRAGAVAVYDARNDRMVVFSGDTSTTFDPIFGHEPRNETWQLESGNRWSRVQTQGTPPPARYLAAAALDEKRGRMIVTGGVGANGAFYADAWALDLATNTWTNLRPDGDTPTERFGLSAAYDAAGDRLLVFGGHDLSELGQMNDTYALSLGDAPSWTLLRAGDQPDDTSLGCAGNMSEQKYNLSVPDLMSPERRERAPMVSLGDVVLLQGGIGDCGQLDDTWTFAGSAWSKVTAARHGEACMRRGEQCPCLCN